MTGLHPVDLPEHLVQVRHPQYIVGHGPVPVKDQSPSVLPCTPALSLPSISTSFPPLTQTRSPSCVFLKGGGPHQRPEQDPSLLHLPFCVQHTQHSCPIVYSGMDFGSSLPSQQ